MMIRALYELDRATQQETVTCNMGAEMRAVPGLARLGAREHREIRDLRGQDHLPHDKPRRRIRSEGL